MCTTIYLIIINFRIIIFTVPIICSFYFIFCYPNRIESWLDGYYTYCEDVIDRQHNMIVPLLLKKTSLKGGYNFFMLWVCTIQL